MSVRTKPVGAALPALAAEQSLPRLLENFELGVDLVHAELVERGLFGLFQ